MAKGFELVNMLLKFAYSNNRTLLYKLFSIFPRAKLVFNSSIGSFYFTIIDHLAMELVQNYFTKNLKVCVTNTIKIA